MELLLSGTIQGLFGKLFEKGRLEEITNFIRVYYQNLMTDFI